MLKSLFRLFIPIFMIILLNISSYIIDLEKNLFLEYSFLKAYEYIQLFLHSMIILSIGFFVTRFSTLFIFGYILKKRLSIVIPKFLIQLYDLFIFLIISIIILNTIFVSKLIKQNIESKDIIRLHVVANSNSVEDQLTKLKVESKIKDKM